MTILEASKVTFEAFRKLEKTVKKCKHDLDGAELADVVDEAEIALMRGKLANLDGQLSAAANAQHVHEAEVQRLAVKAEQSLAANVVSADDNDDLVVRCDFPELYFEVSRVWKASRSPEDRINAAIRQWGLAFSGTLKDLDDTAAKLPQTMRAMLPSVPTIAGAFDKRSLVSRADAMNVDFAQCPLKVLKRYAVKSASDLKSLRAALLLPKKIANEHVLVSDGVLFTNDLVTVVLPFCPGGNLSQWLKKEARPWLVKLDVLRQVASAVVAVHSAGVVHRDIKPLNVLMTSPHHTAVAKLGDFDEGKDLSSLLATVAATKGAGGIGTLGFMAPEVRINGRADKEADVFALAATAVSVLILNGDLERAPRDETGVPDYALALLDVHIDGMGWNELAPVLGRGLDPNPALRPTAEQMLYALSRRMCSAESHRWGETLLDEGILCPVGEHFWCQDCLFDAVDSFIAAPLGRPLRCACGQEFSDSVLLKVLPMANFLDLSRARLIRIETLAKMEGEAQGQRLADAKLETLVVDKFLRELENEVLSFSCPNPECRRVSADFTGCLALTCGEFDGPGHLGARGCGTRFCALCRETVNGGGGDIHGHTALCKYNPTHGQMHLATPFVEPARDKWRLDEIGRRIESMGQIYRPAIERDSRFQRYIAGLEKSAGKG